MIAIDTEHVSPAYMMLSAFKHFCLSGESVCSTNKNKTQPNPLGSMVSQHDDVCRACTTLTMMAISAELMSPACMGLGAFKLVCLRNSLEEK